jgi:hypothetical protein
LFSLVAKGFVAVERVIALRNIVAVLFPPNPPSEWVELHQLDGAD